MVELGLKIWLNDKLLFAINVETFYINVGIFDELKEKIDGYVEVLFYTYEY